MALMSKRTVDAERFKAKIHRYWEITDHGPINWFLGFEIKHDRDARTISINQHAYIEGIIKKFGLTNARPISTPMEPALNSRPTKGHRQPTNYPKCEVYHTPKQ